MEETEVNVYGCGFNGFGQLSDYAHTLRGSSSGLSTYNERNAKHDNEHSFEHPQLLSRIETKYDQNGKPGSSCKILFTWSQMAISSFSDKGLPLTQLSGHTKNDEDKLNKGPKTYTSTTAVAVTNSDILVKNVEDDNPTWSVIKDGNINLLSLHIDSERNVTLSHVAGGHADFYTIYDAINFGILKNEQNTRPSKAPDQKQSSLKLCLHHIDCVITIKAISCGKEHALLLTEHGTVYSYGLGSRGQLGHGTVEKESSLKLVEALEGVQMTAISAGGWHSAAVSGIGDVYVWGWNESGQLGLTSSKGQSTEEGSVPAISGEDEVIGIQPVPRYVSFPDEINICSVACGSRHTLILTSDGKVFSSGWNAYGQLGLGHKTNMQQFTHVTGIHGRCNYIFAGHWNSAFVCDR